jgi:membrane dipeptidase
VRAPGWLIVDGHQDIAMALMEAGDGRDFSVPAPPGQALSLPDAKRGGLGLILGTVFAPNGYWEGRKAHDAGRDQVDLYDRLLRENANDLFRVESRGDLALCRAGGPIGIVHLMEGADPIRSPRELSRWVDRGVRVVGIAWNTRNRYCGGVKEGTGLTADGRALLAEMRRLSVIPDVSHLVPAAFDDVLGFDDGLVVASHSNAYAVRPHPRNLTDAQIRRIAERDGLVGVVLFNPFLGENGADMGTILAHIDHIVSLVGPEHVGIGSDLDGGFTTADAPHGIRTVADLRAIGEALGQRGYGDADVARILGGNWLRVLRQALPD